MKHGSLFSGIGGFDLAAEWMGWENIFHCEWMEFPRKVLNYYWPDADSHIDIFKTDFTKYANTIDILTGGFPCQPFSLAGKRKGRDDERYLWHEMLRAIREIKPKYVIAENVFGIVNIDSGMVFEQVCLDLENEGYEVQPFIIPAAAKNAPHRRDRCWFVAYCNNSGFQKARTKQQTARIIKYGKLDNNAANPDSNGQHECNSNDEINASERGINAQCNIEQSIVDGDATDTDKFSNNNQSNIRSNTKIIEQRRSEGERLFTRKSNGRNCQNNGDASDTESVCIQGQCDGQRKGQFRRGDWCRFPTQSPICGGDDGLPTELDGITFSKWRNESIKGYGNAIVPQIAYQLFQIIEHESKNQNT